MQRDTGSIRYIAGLVIKYFISWVKQGPQGNINGLRYSQRLPKYQTVGHGGTKIFFHIGGDFLPQTEQPTVIGVGSFSFFQGKDRGLTDFPGSETKSGSPIPREIA